MLEIGVQTKGLLPEKSPLYAIKKIKDAGFSRIDMNLDIFLKNSDLYAGKVNPFFDKSLEELCEFFTPYVEAMLTYGVRPSPAPSVSRAMTCTSRPAPTSTA